MTLFSGTRIVWLMMLAAVVAGAAESFQLREPHLRRYQIGPGPTRDWLVATQEGSLDRPVEMSSRVVLKLSSPDDFSRLTARRPLQLSRVISSNLFILQAPDAVTALREAGRLARLPGVLASHPVMRRELKLHGPYAPPPNDPYFAFHPDKPVYEYQWSLENRGADGTLIGMDLNVRAAWPFSRGEGVIIAIADNGMEVSHPDLAARTAGAPHYHFGNGSTNGAVAGSAWHGTCVAGLAAAESGNQTGIAGVAPRARLASWTIFPTGAAALTGEQLMEMFQYRSNTVAVQNHSWGTLGKGLAGPTAEERAGIDHAVHLGRGGRGVVMVRSAGNDRARGDNANDDGYLADPLAIAVGAVDHTGRVTFYSTPGACLLLAAPGGDGAINLLTTDRTGVNGYNYPTYPDDPPFADYTPYGFYGTSAAAPLVSGVAALVLAANTNLAYRDVQQILLHSARHFDLADPDLQTNGAGFRVSHNAGFGVPDAGLAVRLARGWSNRPPLTLITLAATNALAIPDDGLRVIVTGDNIPTNLASIAATAGLGLHPDAPTPDWPLFFAGLATNVISQNLTGKVALIQRGTNDFSEKIADAAQAGAAAAIIFNHSGGDARLVMGQTDFSVIQNVFIGQTPGEGLRDLLATNATARARLQLNAHGCTFTVTNTLLCEHVAVQIQTDHARRGDLRLTLVSPQGTRSVLQRMNDDDAPGPADWTYVSTHHFFESSAGVWRLEVSDEQPANTGGVLLAALTIYGVAITDADGDGLDDAWELAQFGSLAGGPRDDPDGDGFQSAREQVMGTNPLAADAAFALDLSRLNGSFARLSWPGQTNRSYEIFSGTNAAAPLTLVTNLPGKFFETEWISALTNSAERFFRVRATPAP